MTTYYVAVIEEYDEGFETPWRVEREGLFKTYRDASQWLIGEGFDVYAEKCGLTDEYELYYTVDSYMGSESYVGYVEEWKVK